MRQVIIRESRAEMPVVSLRKHDMRSVKPGNMSLYFGRRGAGKSWLMMDSMYYHREIKDGICFSGTETVNNAWGDHMPYSFIYDGYAGNEEKLRTLFDRQMLQGLERLVNKAAAIDETFVIFEDCLSDSTFTHDKLVRKVATDGRHYKMTIHISSQWPKQLTPDLRSMFDFIYVMQCPDPGYTQRIYDDWFKDYMSRAAFGKMHDEFTKDRGCLVLDNRPGIDRRLEARVFYYKAENHGDFKVGSRGWWLFHHMRAKTPLEMYEEKKREIQARISAANGGDLQGIGSAAARRGGAKRGVGKRAARAAADDEIEFAREREPAPARKRARRTPAPRR